MKFPPVFSKMVAVISIHMLLQQCSQQGNEENIKSNFFSNHFGTAGRIFHSFTNRSLTMASRIGFSFSLVLTARRLKSNLVSFGLLASQRLLNASIRCSCGALFLAKRSLSLRIGLMHASKPWNECHMYLMHQYHWNRLNSYLLAVTSKTLSLVTLDKLARVAEYSVDRLRHPHPGEPFDNLDANIFAELVVFLK